MTLLWPYIYPSRVQMGIGLLCIGIASWLTIVATRYVKYIVDAIQAGVYDGAEVRRLAVLLVLVATCEGIARFFMRHWMIGSSRRIEWDMRNAFYRKLSGLSSTFYDVERTGDVMERATGDVEAVRMWLGPGIMHSANTVIFLPFALYELFRNSVPLTLLSLTPFVILAFGVKYFGSLIYLRSKAAQDQMGLMGAMVQESFSGIRVVKAFRQEQARLDEFRNLNNELIDRNVEVAKVQAGFFPFMTGMGSLGFLITVWAGSFLVVNGGFEYGGFTVVAPTVGSLTQFILILGSLTWPTIALGWSVNLFQRGRASMNRIQKVMDSEPLIQNSPDAVLPGPDWEPTLVIENLTFSYPNPPSLTGDAKKKSANPLEAEPAAVAARMERLRKLQSASGKGLEELQREEGVEADPIVLQDISVTLPAGRTLGIVGPIGSGKSSLARLLARLYPVPPGTIRLGGVDLNELPLDFLRRKVGYVFQETFLFSESIRDNIRFGRPEATDAEVEEACRAASLHEDIMGFPKGYSTMLGERGINLSGGQKQRAAIARSLIYDPALLVLDDALSAVDTETEASILHALRERKRRPSLIIIAHRLSTLADADRILVLDQGRIIEQGSHHELLALGGLYARTWEDQQLAAQISR